MILDRSKFSCFLYLVGAGVGLCLGSSALAQDDPDVLAKGMEFYRSTRTSWSLSDQKDPMSGERIVEAVSIQKSDQVMATVAVRCEGLDSRDLRYNSLARSVSTILNMIKSGLDENLGALVPSLDERKTYYDMFRGNMIKTYVLITNVDGSSLLPKLERDFSNAGEEVYHLAKFRDNEGQTVDFKAYISEHSNKFLVAMHSGEEFLSKESLWSSRFQFFTTLGDLVVNVPFTNAAIRSVEKYCASKAK